MQEIWWPLSGGYRESVAPMLPAPDSYYLNKAALMEHNDLLSAAREKEEQNKKPIANKTEGTKALTTAARQKTRVHLAESLDNTIV